MKTLQNNFTTSEQSKRLLELGVPADSADCYYLRESPNRLCILNDGVTISNLRLRLYMSHTMPCWSVGRLVEILGICAGMERVDFETLARTEGTWPEKLIRLIEDLAKYDKLDLFKLEE